MNENINLCKILKDCPKGTEFYSPFIGNVRLSYLGNESENFPIEVSTYNENTILLLSSGKADKNGEVMLLPSKNQRDWSKWKCPKPKFDPKTLKPFDKVLIRPTKDFCWNISLFSYVSPYPIRTSISTISGECDFCIPFNEDTKHLLGTNYDAPEYYRYWED